ncbi:nucleoside triphosphate pyrophosphohydrolase [Ferrimonas sp. YFM]|nr:nucleoside triphosphate pyrophosphohydrolase [Ferrimonas sp. YFM]
MSQMDRLLAIMAKLRDPDGGCPWDLKQDFASIVPHTLEEAYEVADAIERGDWEGLPGELGDLLFQVVFYAQLGKEKHWFDFEEVARRISDKLERRHPHVFTDAQIPETELKANWEATKSAERADKGEHSLLDDIPRGMPALTRSVKIQKRVATVGFDWDSLGPVVDKVHEEVDEVLEEAHQVVVDQEKLTEEVGDLLFAVTNLARHLKVNPEQALRRANDKFERRFRGVEALAGESGRELDAHTLEQLEAYWQQVKGRE